MTGKICRTNNNKLILPSHQDLIAKIDGNKAETMNYFLDGDAQRKLAKSDKGNIHTFLRVILYVR